MYGCSSQVSHTFTYYVLHINTWMCFKWYPPARNVSMTCQWFAFIYLLGITLNYEEGVTSVKPRELSSNTKSLSWLSVLVLTKPDQKSEGTLDFFRWAPTWLKLGALSAGCGSKQFVLMLYFMGPSFPNELLGSLLKRTTLCY